MKSTNTINFKKILYNKRLMCCLLVFIFSLTTLTSCNNSSNSSDNLLADTQKGETNNPSSTDNGEDNLGSAGNETDNPSSTGNGDDDLLKMGDPDYDYTGVLGYGYNVVTKGYFNEDDISAGGKILDTKTLSKEGYILRKSRVEQNSQTTAGSSMISYQQDVAQRISGSFSYGLFSKIKFDFELSSLTDDSTISQNVYIKDMIRVIKEREYIDTSDLKVKDLIKYTKSKFRDELNEDVSTLSYDEQKDHYYKLFNTYGTHVLLDILLGGRIDMNYVYKNTESKSISSIKSDAKIVYESFKTKAGAELSEDVKTTVNSFNKKVTLVSNRVGGTVEGEILSIADAAAVYNNWTKSFTDRSTYEFVDIGDGFSNALLGIWELADTKEISDKVYEMYCLYLGEAGQYFADFDDKADNTQYLKMLYSNSSGKSKESMSGIESTISHKEPNTPYYILPYDLNKGVSTSNYNYLAYTYTTKKSEAIRDIRILVITHNTPNINFPETITLNNCTYHEHNFNINFNGNSRMLLYYTTDERAGTPIKEIGFENNTGYTFGSTAAGWTSVLANGYTTDQAKLENEFNWRKVPINNGAQVPNIYLWFRR